MIFKAKFEKMLHSDDSTKVKVNISFPTKPRVTIARACNEGNQSEVENYVGVFIDYGLTGPRVRARIARLQCTRRERRKRERKRAGENFNSRRGRGFTIRNTREK